jgi:hypothetical protein
MKQIYLHVSGALPLVIPAGVVTAVVAGYTSLVGHSCGHSLALSTSETVLVAFDSESLSRPKTWVNPHPCLTAEGR